MYKAYENIIFNYLLRSYYSVVRESSTYIHKNVYGCTVYTEWQADGQSEQKCQANMVCPSVHLSELIDSVGQTVGENSGCTWHNYLMVSNLLTIAKGSRPSYHQQIIMPRIALSSQTNQ